MKRIQIGDNDHRLRDWLVPPIVLPRLRGAPTYMAGAESCLFDRCKEAKRGAFRAQQLLPVGSALGESCAQTGQETDVDSRRLQRPIGEQFCTDATGRRVYSGEVVYDSRSG